MQAVQSRLQIISKYFINKILGNFPGEYIADNKKKIKSMNETIKKCGKNKCFKSLDEYKRLPWTT